MKFKDFHFPYFYKGLKRKMATTHIKDISLLLGYAYPSKEDVAIEIGSGSGFLTIALARVVKELESWEIREDAYQITLENLRKLKINNVKLRLGNFVEHYKDKEEKEKFDIAVVDIKNAYSVVSSLLPLLKPSSRIVIFSLNVENAKQAHLELSSYFKDVFTLSSIVFSYKITPVFFRPEHFALSHTSYLTFGIEKKDRH